jgi:O-6-methylguanine DNA methyltransferase
LDLIEYNIQESPLGYILLVANNGRLFRLGIMAGEPGSIKKEIAVAYPGSVESEKPFGDLWRDLAGYFKGEKVKFHVEMDFSDLRPFTLKVLKELMNIPYGELRSYGWIGKQLGYPNASRAVGQAVGRNPVPIIIPCHRVIREDGAIGGFSSGIGIKEKLLTIEGSLSNVKHKP